MPELPAVVAQEEDSLSWIDRLVQIKDSGQGVQTLNQGADPGFWSGGPDPESRCRSRILVRMGQTLNQGAGRSRILVRGPRP